MEIFEKISEKIILSAYKNGGTLEYSLVQKLLDDDNIVTNVLNVLSCYGTFCSYTLDSPNGWDYYQLTEKGMDFAREGCFTGKYRKNILLIAGSISAIIAAVASIASLFL